MSDDVTKVNSHIKWLWSVLASACLFYAGLTANCYISQQKKNEHFTEKFASKDVYLQKEISKIQVDVAVIKMQVAQLYKSIEEEFERQRKERELEKMKAIHNKKGETEQ